MRTELLLGSDVVEKIHKTKVMVIGLGGVGSYCLEALVRMGINDLYIIDGDVFDVTNINRQLFALNSSVGKDKCKVAKERMLDINPDVNIITNKIILTVDNLADIPLFDYDYVIDAIDTLNVKTQLVKLIANSKTKLITACGAGYRLDSNAIRVGKLWDTTVCPVAKIMRREIKDKSLSPYKVVYSVEEFAKPKTKQNESKEDKTDECEVKNISLTNCQNTKQGVNSNRKPIASIMYMPALMGLILAEEVVKDIANS